MRDHMEVVIARLWHGWTTDEKADAYQALVTGEILPRIEGLDWYGPHANRAGHVDDLNGTVLTLVHIEPAQRKAGAQIAFE